MKMGKAWAWFSLLAMVIMVCGSQAQDTSCLTQLVPCLGYLNSTSTTPSSSCCDPLKSVIKSNPQCLCSMITSNAGGMQGGAINMTQALLLPARCGENVNAASCNTGSPTSGSPGSPTNGSPTTRTAVPSSASRFSFVNMLLAAGLPLIIQITWA
ncbi:non-specific lipid transfer protein GPI-anchored 30-like [Magnolia sinica]|uniref:non-specific lipid transfer protein GPI-anchored 30-like n=1 Tax=Magnolia sinica TaxID=86752 RepID=UPI00265ACBF3|nr:non-specific lipid transfer protein GPI-anchored 30-like [Magnolia sinica]